MVAIDFQSMKNKYYGSQGLLSNVKLSYFAVDREITLQHLESEHISFLGELSL